MSFDTGRYQLYSALKTAKERWDDVQEHWQDSVREEFAETFWEPLAARTQAVLNAIDRLAQVTVHARQDCS